MQKIGEILKSHGVQGHIIISHSLTNNIDCSQWDALMFELNPNSYIPFFIQEITAFEPNKFKVKFEEINSPEEVQQYNGISLYASPNIKIKEEEFSVEIDNYIGYSLLDKEKEIGLIDNILNPNVHPLFIINEGKKNELLIPANEELIISVDNENKKIRMDLPVGLVD